MRRKLPKIIYLCGRCLSKFSHAGKCPSCHLALEKLCLYCGNSEGNCFYVKCERLKKMKGKKKK